MASIEDIQAELASKKAAYHEVSDKLSGPELRALSNDIKAVRKRLVDTITDGCVPCAVCGNAPHGHAIGSEFTASEVAYEIDCLACPHDRLPLDTDPRGRKLKLAREGATVELAREAWNKRQSGEARDDMHPLVKAIVEGR